MKQTFTIEVAAPEDAQRVLASLIQFNDESMPHLPPLEVKKLDFVLKDADGVSMGGICAEYFWNILFIKLFCIEKSYRKQQLGSVLIEHVENIAKKNGCYMVHLDTFDFQAKDFYLKHGYEIFGTLNDCPPGHSRYFLTKKL
jgi:GNAT superfamily N-acetyltransferase